MKAFKTAGASFQIVPDDAPIPAGATMLTLHSSVAGAPLQRLVSDGVSVRDRDTVTRWYIGPDGAKSAAPIDGGQPLDCSFGQELLKDGDAWIVRPAADVLRSRLAAYAADARWRKEVGGITVAGVPVATDDRSKQMIIGARIAADADAGWATQWVGGDGAIYSIDAAAIVAISNAVQAHVNACFATFATVMSGIENATIVDEAGVDAAFAGE